jgi:hypothetical protein
LCAAFRFRYGKTLDREIAGVAAGRFGDNAGSAQALPCRRAIFHAARLVRIRRRPNDTGGCMDLAMAMGLALFGMFAGSTFVFFYKISR